VGLGENHAGTADSVPMSVRSARRAVAAGTVLLAVAFASVATASSSGAVRVSHGALGSRTHPVPIGRAFSIAGGWRLKVVSVIPNATQAILAVRDTGGGANVAPPHGAQDFLVLVEATYTAGGSGNPASLDDSLEAEGAHNALYTDGNNGCGALPSPPAFGDSYSDVFSGQTVRGHVCWQIASNDAASLKLDAVPEPGAQGGIWFALR
jgi:hypothetical protein